MKKCLFPILISFSLLTGCTAAQTDIRQVDEAADTVEITELTTDEMEQAEEGYASFAVSLLRHARKENRNTLVSPLSAALALGMTANGSAGDTRAEFEALFGMDPDMLNAYCADALRGYSGLGGSTRSTLVNSLWCDPDLELNETFTARCQQNYDAQIYQTDLQSPSAVKAVNNWVNEATDGLIPETVERFLDNAVLALVNAIYLQNKFENPFVTPQMEWEMDFTAEDGTVSHPEGMSNGSRQEWYLSGDNGEGVVLPYDDGQLGFLLMLPEEGTDLDDYLESWNGKTVKSLLDGKEKRKVTLTVPKYEIEWSDSLIEPLSEMGLVSAFDPKKADFSDMGTDPENPVYIGDVIHKTVMKVNEKGTEAAAVTVVESVSGSAMQPEDVIKLRFERPFVYGIVDLDTGALLFLGTVENLE